MAVCKGGRVLKIAGEGRKMATFDLFDLNAHPYESEVIYKSIMGQLHYSAF